MRRKTAFLTLCVAATALGLGWWLAGQFESPYNLVIFSSFFTLSLVTIYWFSIMPVRFSNAFSDVARRKGYDFRLIDGAPHLLGTFEGRNFAISVVTQPARNFLGYRTECVTTCTIQQNIPSGFRVHHRAELSWYHELSGAHEVNVGPLSKAFMIEGKSIDETRDFCDLHAGDIERLHAGFPRFLITGADPFQISDVESDHGVLTVVTKLTTSAAVIEGWISDLVQTVKKLESS